MWITSMDFLALSIPMPSKTSNCIKEVLNQNTGAGFQAWWILRVKQVILKNFQEVQASAPSALTWPLKFLSPMVKDLCSSPAEGPIQILLKVVFITIYLIFLIRNQKLKLQSWVREGEEVWEAEAEEDLPRLK